MAVSIFVCIAIAFYVDINNAIVSYNNAMNDGSNSPNYTERLKAPASRTYYIAAVERYWDYAPTGINMVDGLPLNESEYAIDFTVPGPQRVGRVYRKAFYRQFTDISFQQEIQNDINWIHLGSMGPLIRGIVGERIKIVFWNNLTVASSMHPHGVEYDKTSEGAVYVDGTNNYGAHINPGQSWVYFWDLRDMSGGSEYEVSSKFWMYHSHIDEVIDTNSGLIGPILITKSGLETSSDNLKPKDVDREFITLFAVYDENVSWFLKQNIASFVDNGNFNISNDEEYNALIEDEDFVESNLMHAMNGFVFGSLGEYYEMRLGERVRWYISAMGTEIDIHTAHWHGNLVRFVNIIEDVSQMMPAITQVMDMVPDKAGKWFYHCHVNDHLHAGMVATYTVLNETFVPPNSGESQVDKSKWNWPDSKDFWPMYFLSTVGNVVIIVVVVCIYGIKKRFETNKMEQTKLLSAELVDTYDR